LFKLLVVPAELMSGSKALVIIVDNTSEPHR